MPSIDINTCPSSLIVINSQGDIVNCNDAALKIFKYSKEELVGKELEILLPQSLSGKHKQNVQNYFKNPQSRDMGGERILKGIKSDGTEVVVEVGINYFIKNDISYGIANIIDITKRHKMRLLIERTQEVAKIGSWQVDLVKNNCIWSKVTYQIHELAEETHISVEDGINFYSLEHRPIIRELVEKGISDRASWDIELKIITARGNEKWVRALGSPVIEKDCVIGLEGSFQDIHEQKLLQLERESLLVKLQRTENLAGIGHWEWTLEPEKIEWSKNLYKIWGLEESKSPPSIEEHSAWIHEEDREMFYSTLKTGVEKQEKYALVFRAIVEGKEKYIKAEGSPIFATNQKVVGFFGTVQDITAQKDSERQMKKINKSLKIANDELTQFAYRTSHDLKAPLVSIRGLSKIILSDLDEENIEESKKNLEKIINQAVTLETLVKDLLDLARADLQDMKIEDISFSSIIKQIEELNYVLSKNNNVSMNFRLCVKSKWSFPRPRILQIINNLVSNSIKYCNFSRHKRFVSVEILEECNIIKIIVEDNGMGIPYKHKNDAFQMFKRYHSEKIPGSGIGMYLLKKHVDALNGKIDFESSEKGTKFIVEIGRLL